MEHNNNYLISGGNEGNHIFYWATNSPLPTSTPSQIPLALSLHEIKAHIPENTPFLTPVIASRKRGRPFKPPAPSRTTLKERKGCHKWEWSDDEITQLINLWKQKEALYNFKCDSFSNRDERDKAVERIIANLAEEGIETTKTQITQKLTLLRSCYSGQRGKKRASKSRGSGTFDVFASSWKFMKDLSFLEDNYVPRKTESNLIKRQNHANCSTQG